MYTIDMTLINRSAQMQQIVGNNAAAGNTKEIQRLLTSTGSVSLPSSATHVFLLVIFFRMEMRARMQSGFSPTTRGLRKRHLRPQPPHDCPYARRQTRSGIGDVRYEAVVSGSPGWSKCGRCQALVRTQHDSDRQQIRIHRIG